MAWEVVVSGTSDDGHAVEMRWTSFGKGRAKVEKYELFRDGVKVGYAVTGTDATANWSKVKLGMIYDSDLSQWIYPA